MKSLSNLGTKVMVVVGFLFVIHPLMAHHSGAGFNAGEVKEFTGTVKEFQFKNPTPGFRS